MRSTCPTWTRSSRAGRQPAGRGNVLPTLPAGRNVRGPVFPPRRDAVPSEPGLLVDDVLYSCCTLANGGRAAAGRMARSVFPLVSRSRARIVAWLGLSLASARRRAHAVRGRLGLGVCSLLPRGGQRRGPPGRTPSRSRVSGCSAPRSRFIRGQGVPRARVATLLTVPAWPGSHGDARRVARVGSGLSVLFLVAEGGEAWRIALANATCSNATSRPRRDARGLCLVRTCFGPADRARRVNSGPAP